MHFVNAFGAKTECKNYRIPSSDLADNATKRTQMLLFNFTPASLKQIRAQLKEKGEGTGVAQWPVGAQHSVTDCLTGRHPSDLR